MRSAILLSSILAGAATSTHATFTIDSLLPPPDAIRDLPPALGSPLRTPEEILAVLLAPDSESAWTPSAPYTLGVTTPSEDTVRPGHPDYTGPMLGFLDFQDILPPDDFDIVTEAEELATLLSGRAPPPETPPPQPPPEPEFLAQEWRVPCPAYPPAQVLARDPPTDPEAPPAVDAPPAVAAAPRPKPVRLARSTYLVDQPLSSMLAARALELRISYRLGRLRSGPDDFWGFDQPAMRLGIDYGATERLTIGLGRSTTDKSIDFHGKLLLLGGQGAPRFPLTAALDASFEYSLAREEGRDGTADTRSAWLASLILASRADSRLTVQVAPGWAQVGRREGGDEPLAWPLAATLLRYRLTPSVSLGTEAVWPLDGLPDGADAPGRRPGFSAAVEIATEGGSFVAHIGNCRGQTPLDAARFNVPAGDIGLGLNYVHGWQW